MLVIPRMIIQENSKMARDIYREFVELSQDYLKLCEQKHRRAAQNKSIAEELGILEFYYEGVKNYIDEYEKQIHALKMELVAARTTAKIIEQKYLEEFKKSFKVTKPNPTAEQYEAIKARRRKGVSITEIAKHFELSKKQIIELADVK